MRKKQLASKYLQRSPLLQHLGNCIYIKPLQRRKGTFKYPRRYRFTRRKHLLFSISALKLGSEKVVGTRFAKQRPAKYRWLVYFRDVTGFFARFDVFIENAVANIVWDGKDSVERHQQKMYKVVFRFYFLKAF